MTGTVHAEYLTYPGVAARGTITFGTNTADQQLRDPAGNVVYTGPRKYRLVDGELTVELPATDDTAFAETDWQWWARIEVDGAPPALRWFELLDGTTVQLADIAGELAPGDPLTHPLSYADVVADIQDPDSVIWAALSDAFIPRTIPDTAQIISTFLGNGQVFWEDHDNIPIFSIPAAGGPRVFGDNMGAWCGVFDKAIEFTPWGSLKYGDTQTKQLFLSTAGPLDAETIDQMERMGDGGRTDAIAEVGDICISSNDERLLWRCITAGTPGTAGTPQGAWVPATVGSSIKSITNHSATSAIAAYEELCYCWNTITVTLPNPATLIHGRQYTVKNAGVGVVTVAAHSGSIIEGAATKTIAAGAFARFVAITSGWILV